MLTVSEDFSGDRTSVSYLSPPQSSDGSLTEPLFAKKPAVKEEEEEEEESLEVELESYVQVKKEEIVGGEFPAARPMEGLKEAGPPPFLKKTYEMVSDPKTDCVVSWSENRHSFVVWDAHEFSKILLPKYFKHSNLSSFIRQLNTYGFKKVHPDRWEFANEGFQGGKRNLLKSIKRRSKYAARDNHHRPISSSEIDGLKHDHDSLRSEITRLRQQQNASQRQIESVEERVRFTESRHNQTLVFLAKVVSDPGFVGRIMAQKRTKKTELEGVQCRKRNRVAVSSPVEDYLLDEQGFLSDSDSKFYNELEDLMVEKPRDWACYMAGLVDQTSML